MCPLQCGCQPTNQRHSATRQRGSDANLGATGNHYWHQAHCLPFFPLSWHSTNKMAVLVATGTQYKRCAELNTIKWFYGLKFISYQMIDTLWCSQEKKKKRTILSIETMFTPFSSLGFINDLCGTHAPPWYTQQAEPHRSPLWLIVIFMLNIDHNVYFPFSSSFSVKGAALQPMSILFFSFLSFKKIA